MKQFTIPVLLIVLLPCAGCFIPPAPTVPMESRWIQQDPGEVAPVLFVFLPGRSDKPEDFLKHRFVEHLWEAGIHADAVLPNAHLGYYYRRSFSERLKVDIIDRAKEMGYTSIWVVGTSLGGFGAVMFERDHPGTWDGIYLIAPFAGDQEPVLDRVLAADSLEEVQFTPGLTDEDYTALFWKWMRNYERDPTLPLFLGFGDRDRMRRQHQRIAELLPEEHVVTLPGGHNWSVWEELWQELLKGEHPDL